MNRIRVGILGCGQIAQIMHLPYLNDSGLFEIYALSDVSKELIQKVGYKYGVPQERQYVNYDDMLSDKNVQVVFICSKDHYLPTVKAARAKKHIFVEKPFGFNLRQAEEMADEAERNGVCLMVGYMKLFDTGFTYLQKRISDLENISLIRVHDFGGSFSYTRDVFDVLSGSDVDPSFFEQGKRANNAAMVEGIGKEYERFLPAYSLLLGVSSHDSAMLRHAFGNEPEVLYAHVHHDSFVTAVLKFGDIECVFESGLVMKMPIWDESFSVYSDKANIRVDFPWPYLKNAPSVVSITEDYQQTGAASDVALRTSFHEAYRNELHHFYDCIVNGKEPISSGKDAIFDMRLMTKIIHVAGGK